MPIKTVNGAPIYMRDVAQVRDGYLVQTNIVRSNGNRSALLTILRHGGASTLSVVNGVKQLLPKIAATLPTSFWYHTAIRSISVCARIGVLGWCGKR